ncbi:MAG: type II toxin-antitoxin system HicA family toxin [Rhodomicrobium sp.]
MRRGQRLHLPKKNSTIRCCLRSDGQARRLPLSRNRAAAQTNSGFEFHRQGAGSHEIWRNPSTLRYTAIPNHPGNLPEGTLRAILKQAGISSDEFLAIR